VYDFIAFYQLEILLFVLYVGDRLVAGLVIKWMLQPCTRIVMINFFFVVVLDIGVVVKPWGLCFAGVVQILVVWDETLVSSFIKMLNITFSYVWFHDVVVFLE